MGVLHLCFDHPPKQFQIILHLVADAIFPSYSESVMRHVYLKAWWSLTCMSHRVTKPLSSMSQIWKNAWLFSSTVLQSLFSRGLAHTLDLLFVSFRLSLDGRHTLESQVPLKAAIVVPLCVVVMCERPPVSFLTWVSSRWEN